MPKLVSHDSLAFRPHIGFVEGISFRGLMSETKVGGCQVEEWNVSRLKIQVLAGFAKLKIVPWKEIIIVFIFTHLNTSA